MPHQQIVYQHCRNRWTHIRLTFDGSSKFVQNFIWLKIEIILLPMDAALQDMMLTLESTFG